MLQMTSRQLSTRCLTGLLMFVCLTFAVAQLSFGCSGRLAEGVDYADLDKQRDLARELAMQADTIILASVVSREVGADAWGIELDDVTVLKRRLDEMVMVIIDDPDRFDRFGCAYSVSFRNAYMRTGERYIVYLEDGIILRAGPTRRSVNQISLDEEKRIVGDAYQ